jgi:hypothetical protein
MAFADLDAYLETLKTAHMADFVTNLATTSTAGLTLLGDRFAPAPTIPTASVALDKTSGFSINSYVPNAGSGKRMCILAGSFGYDRNPFTIVPIDILSISGGLSGTVTGAQTTNLPTATLTRYTNGIGVQAGLIIWTTIGSTATTATVTYTNSDGTGSRVSPAFQLGGSLAVRDGTSLVRIPMQGTDIGVKSVESINLAGSTGTAGNMGVVLYKPLGIMIAGNGEGYTHIDSLHSGRFCGQMNEVLNDACLSLAAFTLSSGERIAGALYLGEA